MSASMRPRHYAEDKCGQQQGQLPCDVASMRPRHYAEDKRAEDSNPESPHYGFNEASALRRG